MLLSDVCLSVAYIGPKSRTERPRKTKIGTEVAHVTRQVIQLALMCTTLAVLGTVAVPDITFKVKGQGHQAALVGCASHYIIYMDDASFYATAHSEPLAVDHEYSCCKACWAPQA